MCTDCPPTLSPHLHQRITQTLTDHDSTITALLTAADLLEDNYRTSGTRFHLVQLLKLTTPPFPAAKTVLMHTFFHTSSPDEYAALFADHQNVVSELIHVRARYAHRAGPPTAFYHRIVKDLGPRVDALDARLVAVQDRLNAVFDAVDDWVRACADVLSDVRVAAWEAQTLRDPACPRAATQLPEWAAFRAWVASLPETGRAVRVGRGLDDAAYAMLRSEGWWDGCEMNVKGEVKGEGVDRFGLFGEFSEELDEELDGEFSEESLGEFLGTF